MGRDQRVFWREAALVAGACWAVSALGYTASAALGEPQLSVAPLSGAGLMQWFWARHRSWPAAVAAGCTGMVVLFRVVDTLRPELSRYVADALATGAAATVSVAVFMLVGRGIPRRHDHGTLPRIGDQSQPAASAGGRARRHAG